MKRRSDRGRDFLFLVGLCVLGVALGWMQTTARNNGRRSIFDTVVTTIVNPPAGLIGSMANGTSDFFAGLGRAGYLSAEVRRLRAENAAAGMYSENVERLEAEIDSLRKLNELGRATGRQRIAADVIGTFLNENRLTLNAGSNQGVRPGLAVMCSTGLIGVIDTVTPTSSQVALIFSPKLKIGAMLQKERSPAGLLRGVGSNILELEFVDPKAIVVTGDRVITLGSSAQIPKGIRIGRVLSVNDRPELGTRIATVFPDVSISDVREVIVLR